MCEMEGGLEKKIDITSGEGDIECQCILENGSATPESGQPSDSNEHQNGMKQSPDDWLPITQSRNGNSWTATFHLLCSGIGTQALSLPLAFVYLGWFWGIICLCVAFVWQLYTIGLLVNLHESIPGIRYSRYLQFSIVVFGEKWGKILALFPVMYLAGGTCVMFIITGGGTMELFYQLMCDDCSSKHPFTTAGWFLIFICLAILVSQFCPNLHSVAFISFLGAIMAVGYCMILWVFFVAKGRVDDIVYNPSETTASEVGRIRGVLNALGIIALAFRGHNVVLEIQGTMPSTPNHPSSKLMWRGVIASSLIIAMCFFPFAIVGYWTFGNKIPATGGMQTTLSTYLHHHLPKPVMGLIYVQVIISCVTAFQIYSMVVFDNLERRCASRTSNNECSKLVRRSIRVFFGGLTFFISVTFPFLPNLASVVGGIALSVTFAYPCLMWIAIKKPPVTTASWWLNLGVGCLGVGLSVVVIIGGVWNLAARGLDANFFHPR